MSTAQITLSATSDTWGGAKKPAGTKIATSDLYISGWAVEIYETSRGMNIRAYYWQHNRDMSREGYRADKIVHGADVDIAAQAARDCGFPEAELALALSRI